MRAWRRELDWRCCWAAARSPRLLPEKTDKKRDVLWQKLESKIKTLDKHFDEVLGMAVLDLSGWKDAPGER